ncbi:MAG: phosphotransferase [Candidatus Borkfalkiaceae bacterium]|nr:phosphotransferase [Christensenellaceae bacterium]
MDLDRVIAVRNDKTVYRDGDDCIKVFAENYAKDDVLSEALNQARVEKTGLNVPAIKSVTTIENKWAIVSEFISGKTLDRIMKENPEKKDEYLGKFVDLQLEVQSKTCPKLNKLTDKMRDKISVAQIDENTRYELHTRLEGMPKHAKLCHGDFNPSNIIVTESGKAYILDWSHATIGNASADAARTYLLFWLNGDISGAEKYLDLFCEKSRTDKRYVQKWMPIVAASQSVKGKPKEREFLLSWATVMDYQ